MIKRNLLYYILILVFVLLTSVFVGARDLALGDTVNYIYFYNLAKVAFDSDHELAFYLLARLLNLFDLSYHYFLALCYFLTSYFLLNAFSNINGLKNSKLYLLYCLVFLFFLFLSDWYYAGTVNGLRQGIALSILYFAISLIRERGIKWFLVFYFISGLFHKSTLLTLPFLLPLFFSKLKLTHYTCALSLFAVGYLTSANEWMIRRLSSLFGSNLYADIKYYADNGAHTKWSGFDHAFVAYTIFWYVLIAFILRLGFFYKSKVNNMVFSLKVYSLLSIFYFVFGFGGFSNRWAFAAWLFVPVLQGTTIVSLNVSAKFKFLIAASMLFSYSYYLSRL